MKARRHPESSDARISDALHEQALLRARHLRIGWWSVLVFLSLGVGLEALHGWKVGWYLDVSNETRRLMFTLAHAHGTLLGLVHVVFGVSVAHLHGWGERARSAASRCLTLSGLLLPAGFFLGGLVTHAGDPGLGVLLVMLVAQPHFLLVLILILSLPRIFSLFRKRTAEEARYFEVSPGQRYLMAGLYFGLIAALFAAMHVTGPQ